MINLPYLIQWHPFVSLIKRICISAPVYFFLPYFLSLLSTILQAQSGLWSWNFTFPVRILQVSDIGLVLSFEDCKRAKFLWNYTITGLPAVIRQKSHVLENFSISVNNKILTLTFSERLTQEHLKVIRKIREIWKKNRNNTPWKHRENHTIFGERDSNYRTPRY